MAQRGERGRTAADEIEIRAAVEEEQEVGAGEEKRKAGPPLHPASPQALSPNPCHLNKAT